eukprot:TRINITY_DN14677_c0_g1_i1.p1 TRINITY_DN14677_c0_g1~~TRINITY_DN14677_c0_g1_i1.p1  ORF type:complete len:112 (-),score=8.94 TRINITY_DN14677_c0_g1_i1:525-860(-)
MSLVEKIEKRVSQNCLLIVNADDFGYCTERNNGICECFLNGLVSSVSLLVNGEAVQHAVDLAKKINIPMGLHLNLTEGKPIHSTVSSLLDNSGMMRGKFGLRRLWNITKSI